MKILWITFLFIFISCQKEEAKQEVATPDYAFDKKEAVQAQNPAHADHGDKYDFDKKKDESCDTEEKLEKKIVRPKQKAFKLQGGDSGCLAE